MQNRKLPKSFYKVSIILITKLEKDTMKKREHQSNISEEHICKNPQYNISNLNSRIQLKNHSPRETGFTPVMQRW